MRARMGREEEGEGGHREQKQKRRGNKNDKTGKENYGSEERMGREMLRDDGRGGVRELQSAAKTRKVRGS